MNNSPLAVRWFDELWNKKNPAVITELMDAAAVGVTEGGEIHGAAEFRALGYEPLVKALPNMKVQIDGMLAEGDDVAVRWTVTGTHTGPLLHLPASGRGVKFSGMTWITFKNGKVMKGSDSFNFHGLVSYLSGGPATASVREA